MKNNCFVVVNCGEMPDFNGQFESSEEVFEHYSRYGTFTERVFSEMRAARREMNRMDESVSVGGSGYVVCGCFCRQFAKLR